MYWSDGVTKPLKRPVLSVWGILEGTMEEDAHVQEDLATLSDLDEKSLLESLTRRFNHSHIYVSNTPRYEYVHNRTFGDLITTYCKFCIWTSWMFQWGVVGLLWVIAETYSEPEWSMSESIALWLTGSVFPLQQTYIGDILVAVNPFKQLPLYGKEVNERFVYFSQAFIYFSCYL